MTDLSDRIADVRRKAVETVRLTALYKSETLNVCTESYWMAEDAWDDFESAASRALKGEKL